MHCAKTLQAQTLLIRTTPRRELPWLKGDLSPVCSGGHVPSLERIWGFPPEEELPCGGWGRAVQEESTRAPKRRGRGTQIVCRLSPEGVRYPGWKRTSPRGSRDGRDTRLQPHLSKQGRSHTGCPEKWGLERRGGRELSQ